MKNSTVTATTEGIKVSVSTQYMPEYSSPSQFHFVFAYNVRIQNNSSDSVQLLRRKWYIHDSLRNIREVEGEGVIGQQPTIEPGEVHKYVSGCNLKSEIGKMSGYYIMEKLVDGKQINVNIPEFTMLVPYRFN